jgi:hypothetical protein
MHVGQQTSVAKVANVLGRNPEHPGYLAGCEKVGLDRCHDHETTIDHKVNKVNKVRGSFVDIHPTYSAT